MPLQIRRGTDAERLLLAVPLANGELLWTTDSKKLFIGDGTTVARDLTAVINYNDTDAQRAAGTLLAAASTTDITLSYNSVTNALTANVSISAFRQNVNMGGFTLNGTGNIDIVGDIIATGRLVGNYSGSLFGDDSGLLVDGTNGVIVGPINSPSITGPLTGNVIGNVTGNVTGTHIGYQIGDMSGSVFGDDSTLIVDATSNSLRTSNLTFSNNILEIDSEFMEIRGSIEIYDPINNDARLTIRNTESAIRSIADFETYSSTGSGGFVTFSSSRGSNNSRLKLEDTDLIYSLSFLSLGASNIGTAAFISAKIDGTTTDAIAPGSLEFSVSDTGGNFLSALDIRSTGLTRVKKGFSTNTGQDLADAGAVDLTTVSTYFTTAAAETATLAAGTEGQMKTFAAIDVSSGNMVITVTNPAWGGAGTMTFSSSGSGCTLQYINSKWFCVGNNGVAFA